MEYYKTRKCIITHIRKRYNLEKEDEILKEQIFEEGIFVQAEIGTLQTGNSDRNIFQEPYK
jgi:hypothetical protein